MLDIQFIRENTELVAEKAKQKGITVDLSKLMTLDTQRRETLQEIEALRAERNTIADSM